MKDHALEIEPQAPGSMCLQDLYFPAIKMKSLGGFQSLGTTSIDSKRLHTVTWFAKHTPYNEFTFPMPDMV